MSILRSSSLAPALALVLAAACGGGGDKGASRTTATQAPEEPWALAEEAGAGVDDAALRELLVRHWDEKMRANPVWATSLGDHRFDDQLGSSSEESVMHERQLRSDFLAQARALDASSMSERDRTTLALFIEELQRRVEREGCESFRWSVSARGNPVSSANVLPEDHKVSDEASAMALVSRYGQIARTVDENIANLRSGLAAGRVANAESLRRTLALVKGQLETPMSNWALMKAAANIEGAKAIPEARRTELAASIRSLVEGEIRESYERFAALVEGELLPAGRTGDKIGVHALPDGLACYEASMRGHINLDKTAEEIHQLGLQEIERINQEMSALGAKLFGAKNLAETIEKLRTDESLYFSSKEEIVAKAESALALAKEKMVDFFGVLPKADCSVVEIPDYEAPYTTIAYYRQPHPDGSKPGEYFINTHEPTTRPRFEMEVLAYHESIPGHHLQIAISQELEGFPLFRKHSGSTAFVEGWALYTERLSEEMGMYSGDLDRMGMLSYDAWRASRLVVDTGIHAKGWTREQAETFMKEHTALTPGNITNEVDRYISWPGQATAYKVGQLEIIRLREEARAALGERFDIKGFHDAVLSRGAVTLPVLAEQVHAWVEATKTASQ